MPNDFYNASGVPADGSEVASAAMRTELAAVAAGFNKLPTLTGNANKIVYVNASGAALDVIGNAQAAVTFLATPSSANLAALLSDETGSGAAVFATSPTLVTPDLGTPSAGVLTNCTGLPVAGGGTGRSTSTTAYGLIAAGTTATGAHQTLAAGLTTQILVGGGALALPVWTVATGSGAPVRATSPTLVTPDIGVATATSINGVAITNNSETETIGIGTGVLTDVTTSDSRNIAVGTSALSTVTGATNVAQNVAVGYRAMATVGTNVQESVAVGYVALGAAALTGVGNTAVGWGAARALTSGARNTVVGDNAASTFATGSNSICIGYNSAPSSTSVSNEITLGNSSIATLRCQVTSITALSDARDKTDVAPLPSCIDTVMALNPVRFTWNMRDGGKVGIKDAGFIAQDLQTVDDEYLRLVYAENPEKLEASYGRLIPVLVKAIQELQQQINQLKGAAP